jgi:hypothetical protein
MAYSKITIRFFEVPTIGDSISISESSLGLILYEIFTTSRTRSSETTRPKNLVQSGYSGFASDNYKAALDLDYNSTELFEIISTNGAPNSGLGEVVIYANYPNAVFSVVGSINFDHEIIIENETTTIPDPVFSFSPASVSFSHVQFEPRQNEIISITGDLWKIVGKPNFVLSTSNPGVVISPVTDASGTYFVASGSGSAVVAISLGDYYDSDVHFTPSDLDGTFSVLKNDVLFGTITFHVSVLQISNVMTNPFIPGNLYFTKDLDFLKFNSSIAGTYISFSIEIKTFKINTYEPVIYNRSYNLPLFQGKGEFHIGTIVHDLLEEIKDLSEFVPNLKTNYYKSQYRPSEISISLKEKKFGATVPGLISFNLPMFKMAKGYKPFMTDGQLALLTVSQQEITRITPKSVIGTSFVYFGSPRVVVKKNNIILEDFVIAPSVNQVIFSYFRFINDLKPGDSLEIVIIKGLETRSQRYLVFQNGLENTYFFFENDNGLVEPYEFSGRRRVFTPLKHITTPKFKNLFTHNSKVKTDVDQTLMVNTGALTKTDHRIITAICKSLNVWCSFDDSAGPYFKVDSTTTKLDNQDTSSSDEAFDIEFNILENTDANIYPL